MKKIAIVVSVLIIPLFSRPIFAQDIKPISANLDEQIVTLDATDTHAGDYFASGDSVIISGTVTGDAYVAAGQVVVDGRIDGDLLTTGGTISVTGEVGQDVRAAGGQITLGGLVGKNVTLIGGNLEITPNAQLGGNVVVAGGNVVINAPIPGDLKAGVGNLMLTSSIDGNIDAAVGRLTLTPKAMVRGDLTYRSEDVALIAGEATVSGTVTHLTYSPKTDPSTPFKDYAQLSTLKDTINQSLTKLFSVLFWFSFISSLVIGYLLVHFFPNFTYDAITAIEDHPWHTLGVGFLGLVVAPALILFLLLTLIGIPLSLLLAVIYAIALYFTRIIFGYWLGARFIHRLGRMAGRGVTLAVGLSLYYILSIIVVIGPIMMLAAVLWGMGAIIITEKKVYLASRKARLI